MATFERRVSELYESYRETRPAFAQVVRAIYDENELAFRNHLRDMDNADATLAVSRIFDILIHDYYFFPLQSCFLPYVIKHHAAEFSADELDEMQSQAESHLDIYEVLRVTPGQGLQVRSLVSGAEFYLADINASNALQIWDLFLGRLYDYSRQTLATGPMLRFAPEQKAEILRRLLQEYESFCQKNKETPYPVFARKQWRIFFDIERHFMKAAQNRQIVTAYGPLQPCDVIFKVVDLESLLARLDTIEGLEAGEHEIRPARKNKNQQLIQHRYAWFEKGAFLQLLAPLRHPDYQPGFIAEAHKSTGAIQDPSVRLLGELHADTELLHIQVHSVELAQFAQDYFSRQLADSVRFKRINKIPIEEIMREDKKHMHNLDGDASPRPSELVALESEQSRLHYKALLDKPVPNLGGLTPRQAAEDPQNHAILREWLRGLENWEAKKRARGAGWYPVREMLEELNLPPSFLLDD